ncbi:hypothetical protein ATER59S_02357 [Aquamicrobium terrae]
MATIHLYTSIGAGIPGATNVYLDMDCDGAIVEMRRVPAWQDDMTGTSYLAFAAAPTAEPTEAQRARIAANYLWLAPTSPTLPIGLISRQPEPRDRVPNNEVSQWAFAALGSPQAVSDRYGSGRTMHLAG